MARCRELFPRCASCGNAGSVQTVALRLKINPADVALGRVWSEPPTLNDVFLEITGRELRD